MTSSLFDQVLPADDGAEDSLSFYLIESADAIAEVGMIVALAGLHVLHRTRYGKLGRVSFLVTTIGTAFVLLATFLLLAGLNSAVLDIVFGFGFCGWLIGFPILGIAMLRSKVMPRWAAVAVIAFSPGLLAFLAAFGGGTLWSGLVWLTLAWALIRRRMSGEYEISK